MSNIRCCSSERLKGKTRFSRHSSESGSGLEARLPDALSGGQRQRVAIARALVKSPALVIADEPTGNLDSATATQIVELLRELTREHGVGAVVATHDDRMTRHCDRVLRLVDGEMQGAI